MKIETSPSIRKLNEIVADIDEITSYQFDTASGGELVKLCKDLGFPYTATILSNLLLDLKQ